MSTNRQILIDNGSAARTLFAGVAWVNLQEQSTSICRFVGCELCKLIPGNIRNALAESAILDHVRDGQVFKDNHTVGIDQTARLLVCKVGALVGDPFVNARHNHATLTSFWRTLSELTHAPLRFSEFFFFPAREARVVNRIAVAGSEEVRQANVYADPLWFIGQALRFTLAGEGHKPFTRTGTAQANGFRCSAQVTVQLDLDTAKLGQDQGRAIQPYTIAVLRVAKAIVAPIALKAWVAWFSGTLWVGLDTAKESFESEVNPHTDILQDLGMDKFQ